MTKTEARLALAEKQRRFEWELARDEPARQTARLVADKTHDLLTLIQIVQLATAELARRSSADAAELIADLQGAADDAQRSLRSLIADACPEAPSRPAVVIGPVIAAAIESTRGAVGGELRVTSSADPGATSHCTTAELEHLVIGLVLACDPAAPAIDFVIRERLIDGRPRIELLCGPVAPPPDPFAAVVLEAILARCGGELALADRDHVALL